jgi:gas vesicle protein
MTGGDAPFINGFLVGAPVGALVGLLVDAARERPARWSVAWKAR